MKKIALTTALLLTALAFAANVTLGQKTGAPAVARVAVGYNGAVPYVFVLEGANLCGELTPRLSIGAQSLRVTACQSNLIVASPEPGAETLTAGTYVLKLVYEQAGARAFTLTVDVTIGAQGEKGDKGDAGPPGSMGATGPAGSMTAGSPFYIQNTTTQQPNSNFNISGGGTTGGRLTAAGVSVTAPTNNVALDIASGRIILSYAIVAGGTSAANAGAIPATAAVIEISDNAASGEGATATLPTTAENGTVIVVGSSDPDGAVVFGASGGTSYAFNANQSARFTRIAGTWKFIGQ